MVRLTAPEVDRLQARFSGTFDLDSELNRDQQVVVVAVVNVASLNLRSNPHGDTIGTYGMRVQDFALVRDPDIQKAISARYPELDVLDDGAMERTQQIFEWLDEVDEQNGTTDAERLEAEAWIDTVFSPAEHSDQVEVVDTVEEEIFSPERESRQRGRLPGQRDPVLQRFLEGHDDL